MIARSNSKKIVTKKIVTTICEEFSHQHLNRRRRNRYMIRTKRKNDFRSWQINWASLEADFVKKYSMKTSNFITRVNKCRSLSRIDEWWKLEILNWLSKNFCWCNGQRFCWWLLYWQRWCNDVIISSDRSCYS